MLTVRTMPNSGHQQQAVHQQAEGPAHWAPLVLEQQGAPAGPAAPPRPDLKHQGGCRRCALLAQQAACRTGAQRQATMA